MKPAWSSAITTISRPRRSIDASRSVPASARRSRHRRQPSAWDGYIWGSQPAVFAESPDRIFIGARGELKAPENPPARLQRLVGIDWPARHRRRGRSPELHRCRRRRRAADRVVDAVGSRCSKAAARTRSGSVLTIRQKHVWVVNDGKHVIHKFTNDGKQLVLTLGETGVAGEDAGHFGMPQDVAFLPDGSVLVADGLRNARDREVRQERTIRVVVRHARQRARPVEWRARHRRGARTAASTLPTARTPHPDLRRARRRAGHLAGPPPAE